MIRDVGDKQARIERAKNRKDDVWSSLAMIGVVGWSVVLPTLLGVALGAWMDRRWPARVSWVLTLLSIGLAAGCVNAWFQIRGRRQ
jgi:ATP synthase protein I